MRRDSSKKSRPRNNGDARIPFDLGSTPLAPGTTLIEASAGTGKTYAIVGLCVRLIAEAALRIDEIVVTTFTIPATAELRERLRNALLAAQRELESGQPEAPYLAAMIARRAEPEGRAEMQKRIAAALRDFDQAFITTIHGLCQRLLRDQAFESGALFETEFVADQTGVIREIADDFWRTHFYANDPLLAGLAIAHQLNPGALAKLLEAAAARPLMEVRPQIDREEFERRGQNVRRAFAAARELWRSGEEAIRSAFTAGAVRWARAPYNKPETMERHLASVAASFEAGGEIQIARASFDWFAESQCEGARRGAELRGAAKDFAGACEQLQVARDEWLVAVNAELIRWGTGELARRKQESNVMSFDDLLTRLHAALAGNGGTALARRIQTRFRAALIDEFQDTDRIQDAIFAQLFDAPGFFLYLIGDPKQAIYAFRGADVFAYCAAAERATARFTLTENHRSSRSYLGAVNALFARPGAFVLDCVPARSMEGSGRADETPFCIGGVTATPFVLSLWTDAKPVRKGVADDQLPVVVAAQIAQLLGSGATIGERALMPSDIAVLVSRNAQAHRMQTALRALNIPSVLLGNASVFKTAEAEEMRTVLAAIATPSREPFLRAALATEMFGATATVLDALMSDARAWEIRILRFQQYHEEWRANGFIRMFRRLLRDEEVRVRLLSFPDGERRLTNVLHLAELMHCASVEHRLGISGLVKWLSDRCSATGVAAEEHELRLETDRDAVQVVTMHKSKGLEYSVVFCPYFWRAAELFANEPLVFHDPAHAHGAVLDLLRTAENSARALDERLAEDVRLLYVAVTRARYRCSAVWGQFNQCDNSAANWLLHGGGPESEMSPAEFAGWVKVLPPGRFEAAAESLAERSENAVRVETFGFAEWSGAPGPASSVAIHEARVFRGTILRDWRIASFSSLTSGEDAEEPEFDRVAALPRPDAPIVAEGIHAFPRGPKAGVCLHQIFETIDFQAGESPKIGERLASFGYDRPELHATITSCVRNALSTKLPGGFALHAIPRAAQLREVEFTFPFSRIEARDLASIFGKLPLRVGALHFDPQRGFLRGFIDLVVEHAGRFYLIDWKSNWLGPHGASYTAEAIEEEMRKHHYRLQYYIYVAALDRFLKWRVADYAFETHFGGVFYLFLRGIEPEHPGRGVFHDRPEAGTVAALNALFARGTS